MRTIEKDTTGNVASLYIVDTDGLPKTGVAYNAAGLAVYRTPIGGTQVQITLSADNWTEKGNGRYEVDVADSVYTAVAQHDFDGTITDGIIIGERHDVVALAGVESLDTAGNGPYPCTWTIEYDTQPLQNAVVAFYLGTVLKGRGLTDVDGRVAMSLAAGQYTVAIEAAGFAHVPEWYTVSAAETTWENTFDNLEPVGTVPESEDPARCTGYATVYDQRGVAESGAVICSRLVAEPDGSGVIGSDTVRQETSDAAAQVVFTGLWIGAQYRFWRHGSEKFHVLTITAADVDEQGRFALPNFYG